MVSPISSSFPLSAFCRHHGLERQRPRSCLDGQGAATPVRLSCPARLLAMSWSQIQFDCQDGTFQLLQRLAASPLVRRNLPNTAAIMAQYFKFRHHPGEDIATFLVRETLARSSLRPSVALLRSKRASARTSKTSASHLSSRRVNGGTVGTIGTMRFLNVMEILLKLMHQQNLPEMIHPVKEVIKRVLLPNQFEHELLLGPHHRMQHQHQADQRPQRLCQPCQQHGRTGLVSMSPC